MENWKLLLAGIRNSIKELIDNTFNINGSVEITNIPEIQKVEITNPQEATETVEVSNLINYSDKLDKIIGELSKEENSADYSEIINALQEVVRTLEVDKTDYSPIILAINNATNELKQKYPEFDDTKIIAAIKEIQNFSLDGLLYEGQVPVIINDLQIKKLVDAFSQKTEQVVSSSISPIMTGFATEDTLNNLVGLQIPPHDYIDLSYTSSNLTGVVFKTGGSGGTTVATLTLGYDGSNNLTSVTKT